MKKSKKPKPKKKPVLVSRPVPRINTVSGYEAFRASQAALSRERSVHGREAGPLPSVADPKRKAVCRSSLRQFATTYFPKRFRLAFANPHTTAIDRMERCIVGGGLFACAMPRGTGKTTIAEVAVLWAVLYGYRSFVVLICATNSLTRRRLKSILRELETNERLGADFPEACHLIRKLERIHNRTAGQTLDGVPTRIEMTADGVILPTVAGSACSGAVFQVLSMEGAIRGLNVAGPNGEPMRPDLVLLDDVQTRESAKSPIQTTDREQVVTDDVLGLAGPDTEIAAVMLCTVIYANDLSDRFLSSDKHPEWQAVRTKMLESFPANLELWDQYADVRRESFRSGDEGRRGNAFYQQHRAEMDAGAVVSWPERVKKGELSGIQSAMNLYLTNPRGFKSEMQNDPEPEGGVVGVKELRSDLVSARLSGLPRFEVPREASRLTAFIDSGAGLLWYAVIAWDQNFGGAVIDYGTWPRQNRAVFERSDPRPSLSGKYPGLTESQWVYRGLEELSAEILGRMYYREGTGEQMRIERALVDCGWLPSTVYQFCRQTAFSHVIYPSKGIGRTATARGVSEWKPKPGEQSGFHWRLTMSETGRGRMVQFDPDAWKTALWERLTTPLGGRGCLTFYGRSVVDHELIGLHCSGEYGEPVTIRGATFDKWQVRPHKPDIDWLDCLVGCAVAASVTKLVWSSSAEPVAQSVPRKKMRLSDVRRRKLEGAR